MKKNKRALADVATRLPFGDYVIRAAKKAIKSNAQLIPKQHGAERVIEQELLYLQYGKAFLDSSALLNRLGWKPRTNLDEGIRKSVEWYVLWCNLGSVKE